MKHYLSEPVANFLPSMVFLWFLVCSVPVGLFMNRLGRKRTVLLSMLITLLAMLLLIIPGKDVVFPSQQCQMNNLHHKFPSQQC